MGDLKTTAEERARLRCSDLFARECVDDWTSRTVDYDRNDEVRAALDDLDTLLAENARLRAVAEAAREVEQCCVLSGAEVERLTNALAALEAP